MRQRGDPAAAVRAPIDPGDEYFVSSMCVPQCSVKRFEDPVGNRANALQSIVRMRHIKAPARGQGLAVPVLQRGVINL